MILDGKCLALLPLGERVWGRLHTGQWRAGESPFWQASLDLERDRARRTREAIARGEAGPPAARSEFDLFFDGTTLAYSREPCGKPETERRFFLHSYPSSPADLPDSRRQYGFENLDFDFEAYGSFFADGCLAVVPLPGYPIERLRTGQWTAGAGESWEVEIRAAETRGRTKPGAGWRNRPEDAPAKRRGAPR